MRLWPASLLLLLLTALAYADTAYAVFSELSPDSKPMKPGFNARVFTDTEAKKGAGIDCDFQTGMVTLAPGTYRISALSIAAYNSGGEPPEMSTVRAPASAGYCRLRIHDPNRIYDPTNLRGIANDDPTVVCIGSPATANLGASVLETIYTAEKPTQLILEHQCGSNPQQVYLRVYTENSKWHLMARLTIQRL